MTPDATALAIRRYATAMNTSITGKAITAVSLIAQARKKMEARIAAWRSGGIVSSSVTIAPRISSGATKLSRS